MCLLRLFCWVYGEFVDCGVFGYVECEGDDFGDVVWWYFEGSIKIFYVFGCFFVGDCV